MKALSLLMGGKCSFIDFNRLRSTQLGPRPSGWGCGCGNNNHKVPWQPPFLCTSGTRWEGFLGPGFSTPAGPTETTAALPAASRCRKKKQFSHYFPFNPGFKSVTRCLAGSEGEKQVKQRLRKGIATLIPPAEATEIPLGTQDHFTSKHCWNEIMDFFFFLFLSHRMSTLFRRLLSFTHKSHYLELVHREVRTQKVWAWGTRCLMETHWLAAAQQKHHTISCVFSTSLLPKISRLHLRGDSLTGA